MEICRWDSMNKFNFVRAFFKFTEVKMHGLLYVLSCLPLIWKFLSYLAVYFPSPGTQKETITRPMAPREAQTRHFVYKIGVTILIPVQ